jgi:DNA-binding transcriptional MerR regulator
MKALVAATGVPKSTILYYVNQGLLPEPVKTSQNMAYYDPQCITRIRYIQNLQRRHRLSLSEIRQMIESRGQEADFSIYIELNDIIFGPSRSDDLLDEAGFCRASGLSSGQVRALIGSRLMMPLAKGRFDNDDVAMGKTYARILSRGLRVKDLTFYVELGEKVVEHEMAARRRMTHHLPHEEDAAMSMELVRYARMTRSYIIDRLFQLRVAGMRDLKEEEAGGSSDDM